ncbi:MAG: glycosyltransferase, partial [Terrimicrobiaceae bacterium]
MIAWIASASCLLAVVPAVLFARNLPLYRPPPATGEARLRCSVLIPARNEEQNIAPAVRSILMSTGAFFEVIVLDDGSTDRTAQIVREI